MAARLTHGRGQAARQYALRRGVLRGACLPWRLMVSCAPMLSLLGPRLLGLELRAPWLLGQLVRGFNRFMRFMRWLFQASGAGGHQRFINRPRIDGKAALAGITTRALNHRANHYSQPNAEGSRDPGLGLDSPSGGEENKGAIIYISRPTQSQADVRDTARMASSPTTSAPLLCVLHPPSFTPRSPGRFRRELPIAKTRVWLAILFRKSRLVFPRRARSFTRRPIPARSCCIE